MKIYTSINDYIEQVVNPALGEHAEDHDTQAIAAQMTMWHNEYDADGNVILNKSGLKEAKRDFWKLVEEYAL